MLSHIRGSLRRFTGVKQFSALSKPKFPARLSLANSRSYGTNAAPSDPFPGTYFYTMYAMYNVACWSSVVWVSNYHNTVALPLALAIAEKKIKMNREASGQKTNG